MYGTVQQHIEAGNVAAKVKKTPEALLFAATWLESYEGTSEIPLDIQLMTDLATVAHWLRREAEKRS